MTELPDPDRFTHVTDWVFDLDNTLYPHHSNLFSQVDVRMTAYVSELLRLPREEVRALQKELYQKYGTTLKGLMTLHGIDPDDFLAKVHDIDYSWLVPDPVLGTAIHQLPGRKFIFTNGDRGHAERAARQLGILDYFDAIFDIVAAGLTPKPARQTYEKFTEQYAVSGASAVMFEDLARNLIEPKVRVAAREMVAATYADLLSSVIEEKTFRRVEDGLYIQISERHSGRVLKGLLVADSRDPAFDLIYYAREGAVNAEGTALIMHDGEVHRKIPGGNVSIIRFDSYSFDLSDLTQSRGQTTLRPGDRSLAYLLNPDPDDKNVREDPGAYRAELHRRLTEWSFPLLFSLVALVIAGDARSHRDARLHPLISALSISFLLRWASFYSANQAESRPFFILVMYAVPLIAGGCLIYLLMAHRKLKIPASVTRLSSEAWQQALKLRKDDAAKGGQS